MRCILAARSWRAAARSDESSAKGRAVGRLGPTFRGLLSHNRCLVPDCGYYEWQGEGRDKTPYYIHPQDDQYLAFADLYDVWERPDDEDLYTFTTIMTEADPFMAKLHHRMPVIMARELEDAWIDPELTKAQDALDVLSHSTDKTWRRVVSPEPVPLLRPSQ